MQSFFSKNPFTRAALITFVLSVAGIILLKLDLVPYGFTLFCTIPLITGFVIGQYPTLKFTLYMGSLMGIAVFFLLLVAGGLESLFCILTLSPLLLLILFAGLFFGYAVREIIHPKDKNDPPSALKISLYPLLILLFSTGTERFFTEKYATVRAETSLILPYPPETVFTYIKSVDSLGGEKPFLFNIGIQQPLRCVLEKDSVGARRTCYFREGTIDEVVTAYEPGKALKMKVTAYNMPGRKWLHFDDAIYLFTPVPEGTQITRITTYRTELKPRFYWEYFETKAIQTEHAYVLNDLKRRLKHDFGR